MSQSKRGAAAALLSAALATICGLSVTTSARAAPAPANNSPLTLAEVPADSSAARRPLMQALENAGAADGLDQARVNIFGHIEGSYTNSFDDPIANANVGRTFDTEDQDLTLNQISLNAERTVAPSGDAFDWGFRVEMLYGGDARLTQANGLFDHHQDDETSGIFPGPDEQFDLLQAYGDFNLPAANGLRLRVGKFTYFKLIDPAASPLYSRGYSFGAALPFTLTGATLTYALNDTSSFDIGINRGWDQALEDNNGSISYHGAYRTMIGDGTGLAIKAITGPELDDNTGAFRTAVDVTVSQKMSDQLTLIGNGIVGHQSGGPDDAMISHAWWYGAAGYAIYDISEHLQFNSRLEWFRDEDGATVTDGISANLYSLTAGLTITPFPGDDVLRGLKIRPEVRYDYASEEVFGINSAGVPTDESQFTGAIEAYFAF